MEEQSEKLFDSFTNHQKAIIDIVFEEFDFEKVHTCMEALDWKWYGIHGSKGVPDTETIKKASKYLMCKAISEGMNSQTNTFSVSTGGLTAVYTKHDPKDNCPESVRLSFSVSDICSFEYDPVVWYWEENH